MSPRAVGRMEQMTCGGRIVAAILIGKQPAELTANKLADARLLGLLRAAKRPRIRLIRESIPGRFRA